MIENLFSSKTLFKILNTLFLNRDKSLSTVEIIKAVNKNQANVHRELEKLVAEKIIFKEKSGKSNLYRPNQNFPYFQPLQEFFSLYESFSRKYILFNEEGGACLLSLDYFFHGFSSDYAVQRGLLKRTSNILSHFSNNYFKCYFEKNVLEENARDGLKKLLTDASFVWKIIYPETVEFGEKARQIFRTLQAKGFDLSRKEALDFIDQADEIISKQIGLNYIAVFDLKDQLYSNYLKEYLDKKNKADKFSINYLIEKLLAPADLTFTQLLRLELLKLALESKAGKADHGGALRKIWENWKWLNYGYRGPVFELDYFRKMFEELSAKPLGALRQEIKDLENNAKKVGAEKEKIYQALAVDKKHRDFIEALSLLAYLKVYRKDTSFLLIYLTHEILFRFNRKFKKDNLFYLTLAEAKKMIEGGLKIEKKELAERERNCVHLAREEIILTGDEADEILAQSVEKDDFAKRGADIRLLDGATACLGKTGNWIYGTARIINTKEDMAKMKDGDILISVATTPDILPAMKKAAAIVTDQGGITCHAAIVSRELNIPCLIATKYATKIFQDGDKIVVCPRHGYVKFQ